MSDLPRPPAPREVTSLALVNQKLTSLVAAGASNNFDALLQLGEIRKNGIVAKIGSVDDLSGSMWDDIGLVSTGVAQFLKGHVDRMPVQITKSIGKDFLRISGANIGVRDIECDGDDSFGMSIFDREKPDKFIEKSTTIKEGDTYGGGGNSGESQLLGLLFSLGLPRNNPMVGRVFELIRSEIVKPHYLDEPNALPKTAPKFDLFTKQYDIYATPENIPDMVYLVTDEPPKVQLGVDASYIKRAAGERKLPKMVFFIRNFREDWEKVAAQLGAEVFDLEKAGDARMANPAVVSEFLDKAFSAPLLSAIDRAIPQLTSGGSIAV